MHKYLLVAIFVVMNGYAQKSHFYSDDYHSTIKFKKYVDVDGKGKFNFSGEYCTGNFSAGSTHGKLPWAIWHFAKICVDGNKKLRIDPWYLTADKSDEYISNIIISNNVITFDIVETNEGINIPVEDKSTGKLSATQNAMPTVMHIMYNKETKSFSGNGVEYYSWGNLPFYDHPGDTAPPDTCPVKLKLYRVEFRQVNRIPIILNDGKESSTELY